MRQPCRRWHWWARWVGEIFECPCDEDQPVVVELRMRYCRRCRITQEYEEVLSCVSS